MRIGTCRRDFWRRVMPADRRRASDFNQAGIVSGPAGGDQAPDSNQASMGAEGDGLAGVRRPTDPPAGGICAPLEPGDRGGPPNLGQAGIPLGPAADLGAPDSNQAFRGVNLGGQAGI